MVSSEANNGFGELPKIRSSRGTIVASLLFLITYITGLLSYRSQNKFPVLFGLEDIGVACSVIASLMVGELIRGLILFGEEKNHLRSRYSNHWENVAVACLPLSFKKNVGILKVRVFF